jgi:thioredoxin reductase
LTHDGEPPASIKEKVLKELLNYSTVEIRKQEALHVSKTDAGFIIATANENYECRKLIFATGMRDILPDIDGAAACWGKTLLHCPYCHGYEVRGEPTMILATAKDIPEMVKLLSQWTKQLYACTTDGKLLDASFLQLCEEKGVQVIGKHVQRIAHTNGRVSAVCFNDGTQQQVSVIYGRFPMEQHAALPVSVGCVLTDMGLIKVDMMGQTTVSGVYAAGDCTSPFRTIHTAMASGTMAGAAVNKELIELEF